MKTSRESYDRASQLLDPIERGLVYNTRVTPHWIRGTDSFWFKRGGSQGSTFLLVSPTEKTARPAFDHKKLASALSTALPGNSFSEYTLPFHDFRYAENQTKIEFSAANIDWSYDLATFQLSKAKTKGSKAFSDGELASPDGNWAAYVKEHNIWVRSLGAGQEAQLTFDGEKYFDYGTSPESNTTAVTERLGGAKRPPVALWSPDSTKLVVQRLDQREVRDLYLIQSSVEDEGGTVRPRLHTFKYPLLGDAKLATAELVILHIPEARKQMVVSELGPLPFATILSPIEMKLVWWSDDSRKVYFIHKERGDKALELYEIDSGSARLLIEERAFTHIEPNLSVENRPNVYVLDEEIIWFSERDGYGHLYLYGISSGKLVKQITSGEWVVRDILHVDRRNRVIYFTAGGREPGRDPYFRHLYSVSIDGGPGSVRLLTPEDADHEIWFSPTGNYFVDNFSTVDSIPKSFLRSSKDGETILTLEVSDFDRLFEFGFRWPERFSVKARDGKIDLYGVIYFPSDFDPSRKYPVIDDVYPGPTRTRCAKSFDPEPDNRKWIFMPQATAELGFIVVTLDGLGTPFRSKSFRDYSYGRFEEAGGLLDHVIALRELAKSRPYMDLERVGIYGHSGGGYASARATFDFSDFYKVAVSSAGVHDLRDYLPVGEKYQGLFEPDKYVNQSNSMVAHRLKGKLLLVYGDLDDNVNPASTIRLIDALVKADKIFDVLVLPNKNHSFSNDAYFIQKRWEYLSRHLLGSESSA